MSINSIRTIEKLNKKLIFDVDFDDELVGQFRPNEALHWKIQYELDC